MSFKKFIIFSISLLALLGFTTPSFAAGTVAVTATNSQGWTFNPDLTNTTPYEFSGAEASTGNGSLYVLPIDAVSAHKFIATKGLGTLVSDFNSIAYDFLIAGSGTNADADQFYLNVYTNLPSSTTFYDCRFDYVPTTGSTAGFTTAAFNATDVPTNVGDRPDLFACPATLAGMPAGSTVKFIALNVGDTTASDIGLAGYLDNVVVNLDSDVTTYDFEVDEDGDGIPDTTPPASKDQCKKDGWKTFNNPSFKNQGQCVAYFNHSN